MLTLAEKIEVAKRCCLTAKDYIAERKRVFYDKFFTSDWKVFVVKRDEETGKFVGEFACRARASNNLAAKALIFRNVIDRTRIIKNLMNEGFTVSAEDLKTFSPYVTKHIKRFRDYVVDLSEIPPPLDIEYTFSI